MLMKPKKENALTIILAKRAKGEKALEPMKNEANEEMSFDKEMYKSHAEEIMSALESKDAEKFAEALKSFVSMCKDSEGSESESEEE